MNLPEGIDTTKWTCSKCGCTDDDACVGGCYWVEPNLCSRCQSPQVKSEPSDGIAVVTVRFPRSVYKRLRAAAGKMGVSMNAFCIQQITLAIQRAERAHD
jgi:hypothetical protein